MPDIVHVKMPGVLGASHVNSYLLIGEDVAVVDAGPRNDTGIGRMRDALHRHDRTMDDITTILVTHPHSDHFGNAATLKAETGAAVWMHEEAADIVEDYAAHQEKMDAFFSDFFVRMGMPREEADRVITANLPEPTETSVEVDRRLDPGEQVEVAGTEVACVDAPGHARGNLVYMLDGASFLGDTVLADITPNPGLHLPEDGDTPPPSLRWYLDTLERLKTETFGTGYGGHGPPMDDVPGRIEEIIEHHADRKENLYDLIAEEPRTPFALMHALFDTLPREQYYFGMSEVVGHLDLLEREERIEEVERDGAVIIRPS